MLRGGTSLLGIVNFVTFLISIPILGGGIWLASRANSTDCIRFLQWPIIVIGLAVMVVSLMGFAGACYRQTWLLRLYLFAMFFIVVALLFFIVFAFAVTDRGNGQVVMNRRFLEYQLSDYNGWLKDRVSDPQYWAKISACLRDGHACASMKRFGRDPNTGMLMPETAGMFYGRNLSPIQAGAPNEAHNGNPIQDQVIVEGNINLPGMDEDMHEYDVFADHVNVEFGEEELHGSNNQAPHENEEGSRLKDLTDRERQDIYEALLQRTNPRGELNRNSTTIVADMFEVHHRTVQRVWHRAKKCRQQGIPVDVGSKKPKNCGKKKVQVDLTQVPNIPLPLRSTIRSLAKEIGVNKSTLHRCFKEGKLRRHSNSLKPSLREGNKKERLEWCLSMLDVDSLADQPKFIEMDNIVHVDEKWFNATKKDRSFYLLPEEIDPHRTVQNKNAIDKVMFLAAVAKPRFDDEGNCIFDGKIGLWPFIRKEPAQRTSRNRERGTLVTKTIKVDRQTVRSYIIAKLLPAIVSRWPQGDRTRTIWIQQDNAPSHVPVDDPQFAFAVSQTGLDIRLISQPPNSPDMNALDLGFFASLQSLASTKTSRNMDELIEIVCKEYEEYNPSTLSRVFLTLQSCLLEVMKDGGGNRYKIPHMNKERMLTLGIMPKQLECDRQLYESVLQSLAN